MPSAVICVWHCVPVALLFMPNTGKRVTPPLDAAARVVQHSLTERDAYCDVDGRRYHAPRSLLIASDIWGGVINELES